MSEKEKPTSWKWLTDFPTTNGQLVHGMMLATVIVLTVLVMMALGYKDRIDTVVVGLLLGGQGVNGVVGTYQKVQKWKELPASSADESGASGGAPPVVQPNVLPPTEPSD